MIPHTPPATPPASLLNAVVEKQQRTHAPMREKKEPSNYPHLSRKEEFICDAATD
jgi:hypothetical protein